MQLSRSRGVGLFSGGAQRTTAAVRAPISRWPSPGGDAVGPGGETAAVERPGDAVEEVVLADQDLGEPEAVHDPVEDEGARADAAGGRDFLPPSRITV
jgi:hypothetical protein